MLGRPEGAWVGDTHVKCWSEGPGFMSIAQTKRRNAVRLAEAGWAPTVSIDRLPIGGSQPAARKRPRTEMEAEAPRKRAPGGAGDEEQQVRRSRRGEANVTLLTELKPRPRAGARLESPEVRKQLPADVEGPPSTEKQPRGERQANVDETKNLVAQLKDAARSAHHEDLARCADQVSDCPALEKRNRLFMRPVCISPVSTL
eukprot:g26456.t1